MCLLDTPNFLALLIRSVLNDAAPHYVQPILEEGMERAVRINPVPGGWVLTGIVVAVSTTALFLALTCRLYKRYHSLNLDVILMRSKEEHHN